MSGTKSPKTLKAMELLKDQRLTNNQIAIRSGVSVRHVRRLRNQMEVEQCKQWEWSLRTIPAKS